jgi:hypothetical protein
MFTAAVHCYYWTTNTCTNTQRLYTTVHLTHTHLQLRNVTTTDTTTAATTAAATAVCEQITRSMGGGVAALSMDEEFQRNRIERDRRRSGGAGSHGIGSGDRTSALRLMGRAGRDMAGGLWAGVTGIIVEPARGLRDRGLRGFLIGICHGVAGVATKPMVGCLDAVTHTGEADCCAASA